MKIALSASGKDLHSNLDLRFGRSSYFIIYDLGTDQFKAMENKGESAGGGAGIAAAQQLIDERVEAIISNNIGPNAFDLLISSDIKMYKGKNIPCKLLVEMFKEKKLEEIKESRPSRKGGF
ncbi:NifB/NifX family molybdenum-iron cluster-binding protein [Clostridium sp. Cult1]|jgi:predicted Fe-Mo cluster-binding NifX family protein|uniref:NifB/NifX family molybdenum-iron cluster-binding protein n=1 Tax=Clostridium sp. Cult1 TaxID=2079002 RepID=UPI001F2D32CB|nr:NifB/NifX family molybdenum-iron cluster-binding protein [Clostridium sp. Cult1]MCF6462356.1 diguanylate cyclase [Clostridium sp. Cult1]